MCYQLPIMYLRTTGSSSGFHKELWSQWLVLSTQCKTLVLAEMDVQLYIPAQTAARAKLGLKPN